VALVSQRQYAKRRGISQAAVWKRTTAAGGPIPTHGPRKLIDPAQADALWEVTMSPQGAANGRATAGAARTTKGPPHPRRPRLPAVPQHPGERERLEHRPVARDQRPASLFQH
jgi:hypothetical protein